MPHECAVTALNALGFSGDLFHAPLRGILRPAQSVGRSAFGRQAIARQWASAEFAAPARLYAAACGLSGVSPEPSDAPSTPHVYVSRLRKSLTRG